MGSGGGENDFDTRVLDQARCARAFYGNAEIRAAFGKRIRSSKKRDNKRSCGLPKAKAASVSKGGVYARQDEERGKQGVGERSPCKSSSHHMPIPRIYIGWVKIQTATAYRAVLLTAHKADIDQIRRPEFTICRITWRPAYQETNKPRFTIHT